MNIGKLVLGQDTFVSCTPYGIMRLFEEYKIELSGKNVVILGRSNIVGKPLMQCCINKKCNSNSMPLKNKRNRTKNKKEADILITAIGKPNFIKAENVKKMQL